MMLAQGLLATLDHMHLGFVLGLGQAWGVERGGRGHWYQAGTPPYTTIGERVWSEKGKAQASQHEADRTCVKST